MENTHRKLVELKDWLQDNSLGEIHLTNLPQHFWETLGECIEETKPPLKIIRKGFAQAMDGTTLWINTTTDERITINLKDDRVRWDIYCKPVKVTIEVIDDSELK
jgi:hypothetical protein